MTNTEEPILGVIFQVRHSSNVFAIPIRHVARIEPIEGTPESHSAWLSFERFIRFFKEGLSCHQNTGI